MLSVVCYCANGINLRSLLAIFNISLSLGLLYWDRREANLKRADINAPAYELEDKGANRPAVVVTVLTGSMRQLMITA